MSNNYNYDSAMIMESTIVQTLSTVGTMEAACSSCFNASSAEGRTTQDMQASGASIP